MTVDILFFDKTIQGFYDELNRKLVIEMLINNGKGQKLISDFLEGSTEDKKFIFYFSRIYTSNEGKTENLFKRTITIDLESVFEYTYDDYSDCANKFIIQDSIVNHLFSPMRKIKIEQVETQISGLSFSSYRDLEDCEYSWVYKTNTDPTFNVKLGVISGGANLNSLNYMAEYQSYLELSFNGSVMTKDLLIKYKNSLTSFFSFIFRMRMDGFRDMAYCGKFLVGENAKNVLGTYKQFTHINTDCLNKTILFDKLGGSMGKILEYFLVQDFSLQFFDKTNEQYSITKQLIMFSNFDTITDKLETDDMGLTQLKDLSALLVKHIDDCSTFNDFQPEVTMRMKDIISGVRKSYRDKLDYIIKLSLSFNFEIDDKYSKKITEYRNKLVHGNRKFTEVSFKELVIFEKLLYISLFKFMDLSQEQIENSIYAIFNSGF